METYFILQSKNKLPKTAVKLCCTNLFVPFHMFYFSQVPFNPKTVKNLTYFQKNEKVVP